MIDPRAIVDPEAQLGADVSVGPWSIIGPGVELGDGTSVASHVVMKGPTRVGPGCQIYQFATVGEDTPAFAYQGEESFLEIGANTVIREGVTIHRGMSKGGGRTTIGDNCLLMAYVHVGHDCEVGNNVIMANNATLAGHVKVGDHANFGGYAGIPQFRNIGAHTHIAAMSLVLKDVPAYLTVSGHPASAVGMNVEGMRRRGYSKELIKSLRGAYSTVYRKGLTVKEALAELAPLRRQYPELELFAASIEVAELGIVRPRGTSDA